MDGRGCITSFDPTRDYFPVKSAVRHATNFTLHYAKSYQVLQVRRPHEGGKPVSVVLLRCGAPRPNLTGDLASATVVRTPIRSLYAASTTHLPLLSDLGRLDVLTGLADASFVTNAHVNERVKAGTVTVYGKGGTVNTEKVAVARPDVLMTAGVEDPAYPVLRRSGVAVVPNAEWLESSALGRAEWLKVMAALTGTEDKAAQVFDRVERDYQSIASKAKDSTATQVLPGSLYEGVWHMPTGGSYVGRLLADAGGTYPWASERSTGTLDLNFESVYAKGAAAPVWLVDQQWATTRDALRADPRYGQLAAVKGDRVWTNTKALGPGGGNDFYERGVTRPDLVLADLVAILHPDLMPAHSFTFYRPVPAR